jgi:hypothetical protein
MGTWGPKLYQDDIYEDVRSYYKDQLKRGKSNDEVTNELIEQSRDIISDQDDAPIFWFALADTQWDLGRLLPWVRENALGCLRNGANLERWKNESSKEYEVRKKVLEELETKLNSLMPHEKRVTQHKLYKCEWKIGDVFAYKFEENYAIENGFRERYAIICKVDEGTWSPGHIIPIVYIKLTNGTELPKYESDIEKCEFVRTTLARRKPEYRMQLLSTSRRIIPNDKLIFIGNFTNLSTPSDEYIIHDKVSIVTCNWSKFEETVISKYLNLNNR